MALNGIPIVKIVLRGSITFEEVQVTVSDGTVDNIELSSRNLLFGADANEGSVKNYYSASYDFIDSIKDLCISFAATEDESIETNNGKGNSLEITVFESERTYIGSYGSIINSEDEFSKTNRMKIACELSSEVLSELSVLSGKNYTLKSFL